MTEPNPDQSHEQTQTEIHIVKEAENPINWILKPITQYGFLGLCAVLIAWMIMDARENKILLKQQSQQLIGLHEKNLEVIAANTASNDRVEALLVKFTSCVENDHAKQAAEIQRLRELLLAKMDKYQEAVDQQFRE